MTAQKSNTIKIGGELVEVKPLGLEQTLILVILLAPHIAHLEAHWSEFQAALGRTDGKRGEVLSGLFFTLRQEMVNTPGDVTRAFALLVGKDYEWIARNARAEDLVNALPVLDKINNFQQLWKSVKALGLNVKYG